MHNVDAMLNLRSEGYTNNQIAQMTGTYYGKVLSLIGKQPAFMTANSKKLGGKKRHTRAANRGVYVRSRKYLVACDHVSNIQSEIDMLMIQLAREKSKAETFEADFLKTNEDTASTMIRCQCCGRLVKVEGPGNHKYCAICQPKRAKLAGKRAYVARLTRQPSMTGVHL